MSTTPFDASKANFLQNNGFRLIVPSFRELEFFATRFTFPGINLPYAGADTPFAQMKFAGDKMTFEEMTYNFIVDERIENYTYLADWIKSISYSEDFPMFSNYENKNKIQPLGEQDITVSVLNSKNNPIKTFRFLNAIPVALSGYELVTDDNESEYVRASVTFVYDVYHIENPS